MAFKFKAHKNRVTINLPSRPRISSDDINQLTGQVQGQKASAPEENFAKALTKKGKQFIFQYIVGAPKGLPGWKSVDFIVVTGGLLYAVEVDTAFTHRSKAQKDELHDAIILADKELNSLGTLYPKVLHVDGESDLAGQSESVRYVERTFGL